MIVYGTNKPGIEFKDMIIDNDPAVLSEESDKMDLDAIVDEIDGKYKLKVIVVCALVNLFAGYSKNEYVYTAARVRSRCMIPECENEQSFEPPWIFNAIPTSDYSCLRFGNSSVSRNVTLDSTCPQHMFDRGLVVGCDSFIYEHQNSAVYEFDLACDEWRQALITYTPVLGIILGLPVTGFLSDHYGRRITMFLTSINYAWIGAVKYWVGSLEAFIVEAFFENLLGACSFICAFILVLEIACTKHRAAVGCLMSTCFTLGSTLQELVVWTQPPWRHFILIINVPQLLSIVYFCVTPESVRWLITKGRLKEARTVLKTAQTKRESTEKTLNICDEMRKADCKTDAWLISIVFQHKAMVLRCISTAIWWISMTIFCADLVGTPVVCNDMFWDCVTKNTLMVAGFWCGCLLMNRFGRKPLIIGAISICGASRIASIFFPSYEHYALSLSVYLIGKICISPVVPAMYVYISELYPTQHRTSLLCYSAMVGQLGVFLVPLMPTLGSGLKALPFLVFGILALVSTLLVMLAPETLGATLPDTMEEAASLGKDQPNQSEPVGKYTANNLETTRC